MTRTPWAVWGALWSVMLACSHASAQSVALSGSLGSSKALLVIDGEPRTVAVGSTVQGVRLIRVSATDALVEVHGKRQTLLLGAAQTNASTDADSGNAKIVLSAGPGGHFVASGAINGQAVQFVVDTGASMVSLSQSEAERIGLKFSHGQRGMASTANGPVPVHTVTLSSVRVGEVQVYNVQAMVVPAPMPYVLLGNSFLSRFSMKRENDTMTLERRY